MTHIPSAYFLKREKDSHKGDFGHVFIVAGSRGLSGAACLCAQAALRSGAGLVTVGIPEGISGIVAGKLTEAMTLPLPETRDGSLSKTAWTKIKALTGKADLIALGPGLSRHHQTQQLVRTIIRDVDIPMVIDADGLNALAGHPDILKKSKARKVITPHPGEMARLLGKRVEEVQKNRTALAKQAACMYNIITVLKGHQTVVASPEGKVFINPTGNPGMAGGGMGDVLTGIIAAMLVQGGRFFEATALAMKLSRNRQYLNCISKKKPASL